MYKKALFVSLALFYLTFSGYLGKCLADPLSQLEQFETYKWYPAQAETICQQISQQYPGTESALKAHRNLVISYILAKRDSHAQQKLSQLSTDFSGNSSLPAALYEIARVYERTRKYTEAKSIYQQITQQHASSPEAIKAQLSSPRMDILAHIDKRSGGAAAAVEQFITDFNDHTALSSSLYDIARRYERAKMPKEAEKLYQQIIQRYPGSFPASEAQLAFAKINIFSIIKSGSTGDAEAAVNSLTVNFAGYSDLSEALYDIAIRYERAKANEQAKGLYQHIILQHPESSHAARAQINFLKMNIYSLIKADDFTGAQVAVDALISAFSGHSNLPKVLYPIARKLQDRGRYEQAGGVYQQVVQLYPDTFYTIRAQLDVEKCRILSYIEAGNDTAAQSAIDNLVANYTSHSYLPWVINQITQKYREKSRELEEAALHGQARDKLRKAIATCEIIINQLPASKAVAEAGLANGDWHTKLGEFIEAISYYQKVADDYPEHKSACRALFMVAQNLERLEELKVIPTSEAEPLIRSVYQRLLEEYADCSVVSAASDWLNKNDTK